MCTYRVVAWQIFSATILYYNTHAWHMEAALEFFNIFNDFFLKSHQVNQITVNSMKF